MVLQLSYNMCEKHRNWRPKSGGGGKKVMGVLWIGGGVGNMGLGRAGGFGEKDIWAGPRPI